MRLARGLMGMMLWTSVEEASLARADPPPATASDASRSAAADVLFRDGRARMESGDYVHACPLFGESLRFEQSLGALFNLATCEEATGKLVAAWEHLGQLLERMPPTDDRYSVANARRLALDHAIPWLTVSLAPSSPPAARISRDSMELGGPSLGVALPVDPGPHEIVVHAPGHEARLYTFTVDRGERRTLSVEPGPLEPGAARHPPVVGYGVGGVGLASLAAGAILGVRALQRQNDSENDCAGSVCRDSAGVQAYSDARALAMASDVAFGVGVVAVLAGAYLLWFSPSAATSPRLTGLQLSTTQVGISF
jgi:hypothetical protein